MARFLTGLARRYGRRLTARPALVGGSAGAILTFGDTTEQVVAVTSAGGLITAIYFVGNPDKHTSVRQPPLVQ